jgi:hypothetical protein
MLGGICLPGPAKSRGPANVHPPWHTSTPRVSKSAAVKGRYQPPWHTSTPRDTAQAKLARASKRRLDAPSHNTPRAVGRRAGPASTMSLDAPYARTMTAVEPSVSKSEQSFARSETAAAVEA